MTPALALDSVTKRYAVRRRGLRPTYATAVSELSLQVGEGETLGLVGESGSGKSTVARLVVRLIEPDAGRVLIAGTDVADQRGRALRATRRNVQLVFQDPFASLDPRMRVGSIIAEASRSHGLQSRRSASALAGELLETVGLRPDDAERRPGEFSGGQRQRIAIARALAMNPKLLVLDEPTSALDVSIQAQILRLLLDLQRELGLAYLFITHDMHVARTMSHRLAVMHLGRIVETGDVHDVLSTPTHPYTQALLSAVPSADTRAGRRRIVLDGEVPNPASPPSGCTFRSRCWRAEARCAGEAPTLTADRGQHPAACHFPSTELPHPEVTTS